MREVVLPNALHEPIMTWIPKSNDCRVKDTPGKQGQFNVNKPTQAICFICRMKDKDSQDESWKRAGCACTWRTQSQEPQTHTSNFWRLNQEDNESEANIGYRVKPCVKKALRTKHKRKERRKEKVYHWSVATEDPEWLHQSRVKATVQQTSEYLI